MLGYRRAVRTDEQTAESGAGRCTTPDGVVLATYDFGGSGSDLLLVHATGFCAGVLTPMIRSLTDRFHCWGVDLRAHGRSGRPADGDFDWSGFAVDVLTAVDHLGLVDPIGFGHSCGGASLLLAEERRPGTFASLYCYEPVVFPPELLPSDHGENPLSSGARRRRETFPSATDAFLNFSAKPPFAGLDPEALRAYVDCGFEVVPSEEGGDGAAVRLRCRREDEALVYAAGGSHHAFGHLDAVRCAVALRCGALTDSFGPAILDRVAGALPSATVEAIPGLGHFGPLEQPAVVARSVLDWVTHPTASPPA